MSRLEGSRRRPRDLMNDSTASFRYSSLSFAAILSHSYSRVRFRESFRRFRSFCSLSSSWGSHTSYRYSDLSWS